MTWGGILNRRRKPSACRVHRRRNSLERTLPQRPPPPPPHRQTPYTASPARKLLEAHPFPHAHFRTSPLHIRARCWHRRSSRSLSPSCALRRIRPVSSSWSSCSRRPPSRCSRAHALVAPLDQGLRAFVRFSARDAVSSSKRFLRAALFAKAHLGGLRARAAPAACPALLSEARVVPLGSARAPASRARAGCRTSRRERSFSSIVVPSATTHAASGAAIARPVAPGPAALPLFPSAQRARRLTGTGRVPRESCVADTQQRQLQVVSTRSFVLRPRAVSPSPRAVA